MRTPRLLLVLALTLAAVAESAAQKQKEVEAREEREARKYAQTLESLKEPPAVVTAETARLIFHVSPLTAKGLLSEQARNALKAIFALNRGALIVRLRAFVAGSGDVRRIQSLVSEIFADRRLPLPVLTVVQVGGLPLTGAQVVLESTAVAKKAVNPHGLAFISGQAVSSEEPMLDVAPLAARSIENLNTARRAAGVEPQDVARVTCFVSSLQDANTVRPKLISAFPKAALNYVQIQRAPAQSIVECEAVARLRAAVGEPLRFLNPAGLPESPNYSHVAMVSAPKVVLSGAHLAFRFQDDDARLAFQRLAKDLGSAGASLQDVAMTGIYPLSNSIAGLVRKVRFEFLNPKRPPAATMLPFEDLPALDASFALDVVAVLPNSQ